MTTITLATIERTYTNNGQHAEQVARFTLTGELGKADNKPFWMGGDIGDIQIKSPRATICHGGDILAHIERDGANRYGFVSADFSVMYIMSRAEYIAFVMLFGKTGQASSKNGGGAVLRFGTETRAMRAWLQGQVTA